MNAGDMMDKERLNKLPKWAQDEVTAMQNKIKELQRELDFIQEYEKDTAIHYRTSQGEYKGLPDDTTVRFNLNNTVVRCNIYKGELHIFGDNEITIHPRAANHIIIK